MRYCSRLNSTGQIGAALFVGSIAIAALGQAHLLDNIARIGIAPRPYASPYFLATLTITSAIGFVMLLIGRELIEASSADNRADAQPPAPQTPLWGSKE